MDKRRAYSTYFTSDTEDMLQLSELKRRVFVEEKRDLRYSEFIKNDLDYGKANQLVVKDREEGIVATIRLTYRKEQVFKADESYQFDRLADFLGCDMDYLMQNVALIDRVAVKKNYRGGRIFISMCREIVKKCRSDNMRFIVGSWGSMEESVAAIWAKVGAKQYTKILYNGWQGTLGVYDIQRAHRVLDHHV